MANSEELCNYRVDEQRESSKTHRRSNSYTRAMSNEAPTSNTAPADRESTNQEPMENDIYPVKWIDFTHERIPILLQNRNGSCPLLAIANTLLLCRLIRLGENTEVVDADFLTSMIAERMLQRDLTKLSDEDRVNYERNVADALTALPRLQTGIDVNPKFLGVDQFEFTSECLIFDLLRIQLLHGWVVDPQNKELQAIINSNASSYNQLTDKMLRQNRSQIEKLTRESLVIQQFLDESRSQLTHFGLIQLLETMHENQVAVLFRNNHFSTIWKKNNRLLLLVSDQGFLRHPSIVFETLTDIGNDSTFTDGYGRDWKSATPEDVSRDRDLAIAIHSEERRQINEAPHQSSGTSKREPYQGRNYDEQYSRRSKKKTKQPSDDRDYYDTCVLF